MGSDVHIVSMQASNATCTAQTGRDQIQSLSKLLKEGTGEDSLSRRQYDKSYHELFDATSLTLKLPKSDSDGTVDWQFADPSLLIPLILSRSPPLQDEYARALREHPCSQESPWGLVIGFDEYAPGDKLVSIGNHKKAMDLYFNFCELGQHVLSQSATWFVPIAVRSDICKEVQGGWSYMLAVFLRRLLLGASGLATAGIAVEINGSPTLIFAKLRILISDGDGLRLAFSWRGASSIKPCLKHCNVLKRDSDLVHRGEGFVEITEHNYELFKQRSTRKFYESIDKVAAAHRKRIAGRISQGLHDRIVKIQGFNYCHGGLPFDLTLRRHGIDVFQATRIDWMHSALQDGALTIEIHLFITACQSMCNKGYEDVKAYFQLPWIFPQYQRSKGAGLYRIFSEYRRNKDGVMDKLRASATELIGMYSILRHWAESEIGDREEMSNHVASLRAGCKVVDIIQMAKKQVLPMRPASLALRKAIRIWFQLHKSVYGEQHFKPKHHWLFDVADQFANDPMVFDQLIVERLHLTVKHHGERVDNMRIYERSVLSGVLHCQIKALRQLRKGCSLTDNTVVPLPGYEHAVLADHMDVQGMHISAGDLVMRQSILGQVCGCVEELGTLFAIVEEMELLHSSAYYRGRWRKTAILRLWRATEVEQADKER